MPWNALAAVELKNPLAHIVKEVAVVGHGNNRSLILLQVLLQPVNALCIKVVRRLVKQEHIRLLKEQTAEGHTSALTSREVRHGPVARRTTQGCHGAVKLRVHVPGIGSVNDVLHLSLTLHELVHLVGIAIILLQAKLEVYILIFL